jgi:general secretion pathway protein D
MAVDNTAAKIQIGDRIPIQTSTVVGGTSNVTQNTSQYLDTGLTLSVTPRINEGGLVAMDLAVEYSNPLPQSLAQQNAGLGPPVTSRSVQTTVLVQSNETILMGGLIKETGTTGTSGIPVLSHIPIIGSLFGSQDYVNSRTELLLIITPRVIANNQQMRNITLELRKKMQNLDESVLPSPKQREDLKLDPAPAKVP